MLSWSRPHEGRAVSFYGMDTEQGESFAQHLAERRGTLEDRAAQLDGMIQGTDSFWRGADAENFRSEWSSIHGGVISRAVERLWGMARELSDHAQEQDVCSAEGVGKVGEMLADIFPLGGPLKNPLAGFGDWTSYIPFGGPGAAAKEMFKHAGEIFAHGGEDAIVPWLRNAHGLKSASRFLGPLGTAVTGVFEFSDRWAEDAGDPSLSTGERVTRATVDAGANIAGGVAGAWGGAKVGAAAGAAIGSIFPGAGTAVGGVIGGVVGAVGGGIAGSGIANTAIDWILG